jgi:hypothetical protein
MGTPRVAKVEGMFGCVVWPAFVRVWVCDDCIKTDKQAPWIPVGEEAPTDAALRAAWLAAEQEMCPNCVTPWKCNGPHEPRKPREGR